MTAVFTVYEADTPGTWASVGTLDDVVSASQPQRMNEISTGKLTIPTTSDGAALLAYDRLIVGEDDGLEICSFIIADINTEITPSGTVINVSGPDLMHELTRYGLGSDVVDDGAGGRAMDDLAQIIYYMPGFLGWSIVNTTSPIFATQTGTNMGTYLPAAGESVFQMLRRCAEQAGEAFRIQPVNSPTDRTIGWMPHSPLSGSGNLSLLDEPYYVPTYESWRGVILSCQRSETYRDLTTSAHVYGSGMGTGRLTLADAEGYVSIPQGWTVDWANSLIITDEEANYRTAHRKEKQFGSIRPSEDTAEDRRSAAIALFDTAVAWLSEQCEPVESWKAETIIGINLRPGSHIYIDPVILHGKVVLTGGNYYIKDVVNSYSDNKRTTSLTIATRYTAPRQPESASAIMSQLERVDQTFRHSSTASTTGDGTLQYHDDLLGRTDPQNHPQYLLANGGRLITGNQLMAEGTKIDGMDPSAHLEQSNAHHNWPLLESDIPAEIARATELHEALTLAADSDPILSLNDQELRLGDVTTQAEFNSLVNQDVRSHASPTFQDLNLTGGLLLVDRVTSTVYRLFVSNEKVYLEEVS